MIKKYNINIRKIKSMDLEKGNSFQWIKGDYFGDLEVIKEVQDTKVIFESNRVLKKDVFAEFMKELKSKDDALQIQKADAPEFATQLEVQPKPTTETTETIEKKDDDLLISNNKIFEAVDSSKKSKMLNIKTNVKYLDPSLYEFLKSSHDNFNDLYKEMIRKQIIKEADKKIDEFLDSIYNQ